MHTYYYYYILLLFTAEVSNKSFEELSFILFLNLMQHCMIYSLYQLVVK